MVAVKQFRLYEYVDVKTGKGVVANNWCEMLEKFKVEHGIVMTKNNSRLRVSPTPIIQWR